VIDKCYKLVVVDGGDVNLLLLATKKKIFIFLVITNLPPSNHRSPLVYVS
jgi:hypothetical protein